MRIHKRLKILIAALFLLVLVVLGTAGAEATSASTVVKVPQGYGTLHTYTIWDKIRWSGDCRRLINFAKERNAISDSHGIVTYGGYFCGALTSTFGKVGDMMLVIENGNIVYPVIMADTKNQNDRGCSKWGHQNGKCIVEFEILSSCRRKLYGTSGGYVSEVLARPIVKVINLGSVYDSTYYFQNPVQACIDNGLGGSILLTNPYEGEVIEVPTPQPTEAWSLLSGGEDIKNKIANKPYSFPAIWLDKFPTF